MSSVASFRYMREPARNHTALSRETHDTAMSHNTVAGQQSRTLTVVLHMFVHIVFSRKHLVDWSQERLRSTEKEVRGAERER